MLLLPASAAAAAFAAAAAAAAAAAVPAAAAAAAFHLRLSMALQQRQRQRQRRRQHAGNIYADPPYGAGGETLESASLNGPRASGGALPGPPLPNNPQILRAQGGPARRKKCLHWNCSFRT